MTTSENTQTTIPGIAPDVPTKALPGLDPQTIVTEQGLRIRTPITPRESKETVCIELRSNQHIATAYRAAEKAISDGKSAHIYAGLWKLEFNLYFRCIHHSVISQLQRLERLTVEYKATFWHYRRFSGGRSDGEFSKLRYWGLCEAAEKKDMAKLPPNAKSPNGFWKITDQGRAFLTGVTTVPRYAVLVDHTFIGFRDESDRVTLADILKNEPFSLQRLLAGKDGRAA